MTRILTGAAVVAGAGVGIVAAYPSAARVADGKGGGWDIANEVFDVGLVAAGVGALVFRKKLPSPLLGLMVGAGAAVLGAELLHRSPSQPMAPGPFPQVPGERTSPTTFSV